MHAGTVIPEQGLGHERDGLAILACNVLDDVFVEQEIICHAGERGEGHAHFTLTGCSYFMVVQIHL